MTDILIGLCFALGAYCFKLWLDRADAEAERDYERERNKQLTQGN